MPYINEFKLPQNPIGLALAGGGIRGYAQIGVLEVIEKHGFSADMISGTSIGSFVATLVAMGLSAKEIYDNFESFEKRFTEQKVFTRPDVDMIKPTKNKINGMVDGDQILTIFDEFYGRYGVKKLTDIKKPIVIVATECNKCKTTYFTNVRNFVPSRDAIVIYDAPVSVAVRASCSFPGVISVCNYNEYSFIDGGVMMNLPVEPLKDLGAYKVMSLTMKVPRPEFASKSAVRVLKRASDIMQYELLDVQIRLSDYNIDVGVGGFKAFDVGKGRLIYKRGENIALDKEEDIVKFFEEIYETRKPKEPEIKTKTKTKNPLAKIFPNLKKKHFKFKIR